MSATDDPASAALSWLESAGPSDTALLGAVRNGASLFYEKMLEQLRIFLCDETAYQDERKQLLHEARAGRTATIMVIAGAIGHTIGVAAVLIAPPIALTLAVVTAAGTDAACETLGKMIEDRGRERE